MDEKTFHPESSTRAEPAAEFPVTVLLIDDQVTVGEAVRRMLEPEQDIRYHYCAEPEQALQMAEQIAPTVILQDLVMPDIDGLLLLQQFRACAATQEIPLIMLSTRDESVIKAEAFRLGANDYVIKPPDPIELVARIRYHSRAFCNLHARADAMMAQAYNRQLEQMLTELRQTQAQLVQTEKMSSLGQMVAGVAHEINNPVNFIAGNLRYINEYVSQLLGLINLYQLGVPPAEITEYLDQIGFDFIKADLLKLLGSMQLGSDRIHNIVVSLRNFSRLDQAEMQPVNLHDGINDTLLILNHRLKQEIQVIREYGELPDVECYPAQLNQVFMNILSNAIDALLERTNLHEKRIAIKTKMLDTKRVQISIRDNAGGIPEAIQHRIFDPFFTTKPVGQGTGLGLSIAYQIVHKHQGMIELNSQLGEGTEFLITLWTEATHFASPMMAAETGDAQSSVLR